MSHDDLATESPTPDIRALTPRELARIALEDDLCASAEAAGNSTFQRRTLYRHFDDAQLEALTVWLLGEAVSELI